MAFAIHRIGIENNKLAVALRDTGKVDEARDLLRKNAIYLEKNATKYGSKDLLRDSVNNWTDSRNLGKTWRSRRRVMRQYQHQAETDQDQDGQGEYGWLDKLIGKSKKKGKR